MSSLLTPIRASTRPPHPPAITDEQCPRQRVHTGQRPERRSRFAHASTGPPQQDPRRLPAPRERCRRAAAGAPQRRGARLQAIAAGHPADKPASPFTEPPAETDAWWLSRSQAATFARRRIALPDECARALRATGDAPGQIVVEFNGASFGGAALAANEGQLQLELGDALAQEMASVLDEDDGLAVELVPGRSQPTLAIHPYVIGAS